MTEYEWVQEMLDVGKVEVAQAEVELLKRYTEILHDALYRLGAIVPIFDEFKRDPDAYLRETRRRHGGSE